MRPFSAFSTFPNFGRSPISGAGEGGLLSAALQAAPQANGILFDQPRVVENARRAFANRAVSDRIEFVWPEIYSMRYQQVLNSMSSNKTCTIGVMIGRKNSGSLQKRDVACITIAGAGNDLKPEATFSKRMDLMMMAWTGGRERTQTRIRATSL